MGGWSGSLGAGVAARDGTLGAYAREVAMCWTSVEMSRKTGLLGLGSLGQVWPGKVA